MLFKRKIGIDNIWFKRINVSFNLFSYCSSLCSICEKRPNTNCEWNVRAKCRRILNILNISLDNSMVYTFSHVEKKEICISRNYFL